MNMIYNASAGTGKTYQITQYYQDLVINNQIDPRDILLMTFSENAGKELRQRVVQRLQDVCETGTNEQVDRAQEALRYLPSAFIGTIHGFCTRLLREHALEAGLSPSFSVLIEDEYAELMETVARRTLLQQLEDDPDFRTFCSGAQPFSMGTGFGTSITETVAELIDHAGSRGINHQEFLNLLPPPLPLPDRVPFEQIASALEAQPKLTPTVKTALEQIRFALKESSTIEELLEKLAPVKIRKSGKIKEIATDFMTLKTSAEETLRYQKMFPAAKAFVRYLQRTAQEFHQIKHEKGKVDFNDQLQMALDLLQKKPPQLFKYIIVDEVQDNSRIQCKIIQALWKNEAKLIICGDKKQSIYTWRGADPDVMPDLEELIKQTKGKTQTLQISYRTKPQILARINPLFEAIYSDTFYTKEQHLQSNFETPNETPCIEFLASDLDPEKPKKERVNAEMTAIANRIQHLISGDSAFQPRYRYNGETFTPTSETNHYRYSDILILLKRTKHQPALEQALQHAQIPYTFGGKGRGLFLRTEVRDVALFLSTITNPSDLFSLLGFLRSPWVGLSDEEIAQLSSTKTCSAQTLLNEMEKAQHPAAKTIQKYRALLATHLASEVVRLLIEETRFDALLCAQPRGTQRMANLRKLIDWIRTTERGPRITPISVARKLAEKIQNPPHVPEAALPDPLQNAVTIMTVHGSKGLSSRVVFVPDISCKPNIDRSFARLFAPHDAPPSLCLKITNPDKSFAQTPNFDPAKKYAQEMRDHESKNLLYVAATRARDLLIFSATTGKKPEGWLAQINPFIENETLPTIFYSALKRPPQKNKTPAIPTSSQLATALQTIKSHPQKPQSTLQRLPATRAGKNRETIDLSTPIHSDMTPNLGSLGHAVLEQLALNHWTGDVSIWLEKLRTSFSVSKKQAQNIKQRIERTARWMQKETSSFDLFPERPFVLHRNNQIIDGIIDLLCIQQNKIKIIDYKFTNQPDALLKQMYREQMEIYTQATQHLHPHIKKIQSVLIVITETTTRALYL